MGEDCGRCAGNDRGRFCFALNTRSPPLLLLLLLFLLSLRARRRERRRSPVATRPLRHQQPGLRAHLPTGFVPHAPCKRRAPAARRHNRVRGRSRCGAVRQMPDGWIKSTQPVSGILACTHACEACPPMMFSMLDLRVERVARHKIARDVARGNPTLAKHRDQQMSEILAHAGACARRILRRTNVRA